MSMNTNKKHKLKKEAEEKLKQYLNQYEQDIKCSTNTAQNEQRGYKETSMD